MEKYLKKCLDSLIVENMDLLEVLVVNDGSKDNSSKIAHEYEEKYPNTFRVIDKENGNYGSCINRGLAEAKGKYVKVLDADDCFDVNNFNKYLSFLQENDVDLVLNDFLVVDENDCPKYVHRYNLKAFEILNFYQMFINEEIKFSLQMHGVAYKRENLLALNYKQTEGISYTDQEWVFTPMTKVKTGIYFDKIIYKYLVGRSGQTVEKAIIKKHSNQLGIVISSLLDKYKENKCFEYDSYFFNQLNTQMYIYPKGLLEDSFDLETLKMLDKKIKEKCPKLYYITGDISSCRIKYIHYWRSHNYEELPLYIKLTIKVREYIKKTCRF